MSSSQQTISSFSSHATLSQGRLRKKSTNPQRPEKVNAHKLIENTARVFGRLAAAGLVLCQGVLLDYFLATFCYYWFLFLILDAINVMLISICLWQSYETITRIKTQRKSDDLARLRQAASLNSSSENILASMRPTTWEQFKKIASLPTTYGFYIMTVIVRMSIILGCSVPVLPDLAHLERVHLNANHTDEVGQGDEAKHIGVQTDPHCIEEGSHKSGLYDSHIFMGLIATTALVFMFLVLCYHNAFPNMERRMWLDVVSGHVSLDVLDCSEFLELIYSEEISGQIDAPSKALIISIIMFSCISLLVPILALIDISKSNFGMSPMNDKIQLAFLLCNMCLVNLPFLLIRFLILPKTNKVSIMLVKNIIFVFHLLREIYHTSYRIIKKESRFKQEQRVSNTATANGISVCDLPALLGRRGSADLFYYMNPSVQYGETPSLSVANIPIEFQL